MKSAAQSVPRQVETTLYNNGALFRTLIETIPAAIVICHGPRFCFVNPAAEELTGYSREELLGMNFYDLFSPSVRKEVRVWCIRLQRGDTVPQRNEYKIIVKSGEERWVDLLAAAITFHGRPALLGLAFDITERKKIEEALLENERRIARRAEEIAALYETTRDLSAHHDVASLLKTTVERAASLLGSPAGMIFLYQAETDDLELAVVHGSPLSLGKHIKMGEGIYGEAAQSLSPKVVNRNNASASGTIVADISPFAAIAAAPMLYGGELVGVLAVGEPEGPDSKAIRQYTAADIELLTFFAGATASAVHNARLFSETRQRLVELELLYQASLSAAQIHSRSAVAQRIVETLENLLNWSGSIWLLEGQRPVLLAHSPRGRTSKALQDRMKYIASLVTSLDDGIVGWVCKYGRPFRSGDVKKNPRYIAGDERINSELCVPLKVGGKVIGCINVESEMVNAFDEYDERLLTTLANQAAVAIENARLFEEARRRAAHQTALNAIITASAQASGNLDEILNTILEQVLQALNVDMGAIWLSYLPNRLRRVASRGIPPSIHSIMREATEGGNIPLTEILVVNDWQETDHCFSNMFVSLGIHASLVAPLFSKGKRIGGLAVAASSHQWTREEIALIEAISQEIGQLAERAYLFEEMTHRLNELETVNRISSSLRSAQSLEDMLHPLIDETLHALNADTGGIWLQNGKGEKLRQAIGRGWCLNIANLELSRQDGMLGTVWETGDICFSADVKQDLLPATWLEEQIPASWSAICVPIRSEEETIGVFLVSAPQPREFTDSDARLLITLVEIASNAIRRMRLYEQTRNHAAELETRVAERTAELQIALQKAQTADRLKSEFVANVNHELRTPLTNLLLYYQMLRAQPNVKTEERLDILGRELQRLRNLIEDMLSLSRLDLGKVTFTLYTHDLNALVQTLVNDRRALAEEHGLSLSIELQPDLEMVPFDEPTMTQAISNILTNALNYTPAGGSILVKTTRAQWEGREWVGVHVQDTGPGISAEDLPHIFERFYRGKAGRTSNAAGTGLGLAIVKQVMDHHHGRIEVKEGPNGRGTIFTLWLPARIEETG